MDKIKGNEDKLISVLKDTGMDLLIISEFINSINSRCCEQSRIILSKQRSELLSRIHDNQDKLYCLDYLTRELNNTGIFNSKID